MSSSLRAQSTPGELTNLSSAGSDRTLATSTGGSSHTHSHRKHHHHHRSRSAPRAPEKPPRKRHMNPGHSLASIPSQIKLSMLNSGLISFGELYFQPRSLSLASSSPISLRKKEFPSFSPWPPSQYLRNW
jgi:hypothetical protein